MKITQAVAAASALLFAVGCANDEQHSRYDETMSPAYSSGRMSDYNSDSNKRIWSPSNPGVFSSASENVAAGKSGSESDNTIVAEVRESLRRNPETALILPNLQISANNGAVVLNGTVQSDAQKRQIESMAQDAIGVVVVNNQLKVLSIHNSRESGMANQPNSPLLSPTSSSSNGLPRLYKDAGTDDSTNSVLNPTSLPNGADKIYHQNGPEQNPNSDQMP